jgi:hypothetical protein
MRSFAFIRPIEPESGQDLGTLLRGNIDGLKRREKKKDKADARPARAGSQ